MTTAFIIAAAVLALALLVLGLRARVRSKTRLTFDQLLEDAWTEQKRREAANQVTYGPDQRFAAMRMRLTRYCHSRQMKFPKDADARIREACKRA